MFPKFNDCRVFNKFKALNFWIIMIFIELLLQRCHLSEFNKQPSFTVKNPRLQLVKIDHVISVYLSVTGTAVQKNVIYLWLSLQQIQTTAYINQNDFHWAFTPANVVLYQSIQSSYLIWRAFQDGDFWPVLNRGWRRTNTLQMVDYWLSSSNVLLQHWTYFPKDLLINSRARYLLHFFYDLI
mgnify:CR=1 FL=1